MELIASIVIEGPPLPWKAPYVGVRGAFSPRHNVMKIYRLSVKEQYNGPLIDSAVCCDLYLHMPIPKSASEKKVAKMLSGELRPIGTPDRTNCAKLLEDCLQGIVFKNDSQIVEGKICKHYAENPHALIKVWRI